MRLHRIAVLTALAFAACGGNDLTRDEFVAQANEICAEHNETIEAMTARVAAEIEQYIDRLERNSQGVREALDEGNATTDAFFNRSNNSSHAARDLAEEAGLEECSPLG